MDVGEGVVMVGMVVVVMDVGVMVVVVGVMVVVVVDAGVVIVVVGMVVVVVLDVGVRGGEDGMGGGWVDGRRGGGRAAARSGRRVGGFQIPAKFICREFLETRHDASSSGDGKQLNFHSAHPAHSRQLVLQQQVIGLVIETPLAHDKVASATSKNTNTRRVFISQRKKNSELAHQ